MCLRITPLDGAKEANFLKIGNFERPSLTHGRLRATKFSDSLNSWGPYSTSIVIGGLSALLLLFLMRAGPDKENFAQNRTSAVFAVFPIFDHHYRKNRKPRETIFGSLVERWLLYWYLLKHLLCSIYFADRWRCKRAIRTLPRKHVQVGKFERSFLPHWTA